MWVNYQEKTSPPGEKPSKNYFMYNSPLKWRLNNIYTVFFKIWLSCEILKKEDSFPIPDSALTGRFFTVSANEPAISGDLVLK